MGKASRRKKEKRFFRSPEFVLNWQRDNYICFLRDLSSASDVILNKEEVTNDSKSPEILDFILENVVTEEMVKIWSARQSEYVKGIVSLVPQDILAARGRAVATQSLFEWNFWGEDELDRLAKYMFGSTKTFITGFMAYQLQEYQPEKEFLILGCGLPIKFNPELTLGGFGDLETNRMNIFWKLKKSPFFF